jgi:hypothetical protein
MKLIMENWRQFLKEEKDLSPEETEYQRFLSQPKPGTAADAAMMVKRRKEVEDIPVEPQISTSTGRARKALHQPKRGKIEQGLYDIGKERGIGTHAFRNSINSISEIALMFLDPTAQFAGIDKDSREIRTASDDLRTARHAYKKNPSFFNGAMIALSALAFIPFIGAGAKIAKAAAKTLKRAPKMLEVARVLDDTATASKELKKMKGPKAADLAKKIDSALAKTQKIVSNNNKLISKYGGNPKSFCLKEAITAVPFPHFHYRNEDNQIKMLNETQSQCFPWHHDTQGRILDPALHPEKYNIPVDKLDSLATSKKTVRGRAAHTAAMASRPIGLYATADNTLVMIIMDTSHGPTAFYRSSGKSGYGTMQRKFVPVGAVENYNGGSRLQKLNDTHPDVAAANEKLADGQYFKGEKKQGKYVARNSELGIIGTRLDNELAITTTSHIKTARTNKNFQMFGVMNDHLPNFSKYGHDVQKYMEDLNKKLKEINAPEIPDINFLDDLCLNKWLSSNNAYKPDLFDGSAFRVRGAAHGGGPTWNEMIKADILL